MWLWSQLSGGRCYQINSREDGPRLTCGKLLHRLRARSMSGSASKDAGASAIMVVRKQIRRLSLVLR